MPKPPLVFKRDSHIIIYNTLDGKASVALYAKDGMVWMNQNQIAELFVTSVPNTSMHITNILKDGELERNSVSYLGNQYPERVHHQRFYT